MRLRNNAAFAQHLTFDRNLVLTDLRRIQRDEQYMSGGLARPFVTARIAAAAAAAAAVRCLSLIHI